MINRISRDDFFKEYNKYLNSEKWKALRQQVLIRDKYKCQYCKERRAEQVHHLSYNNYRLHGNSTIEECVSVCMACHSLLHSGDINEKTSYDSLVGTQNGPYVIEKLSRNDDGHLLCPLCETVKVKECSPYFLDGREGFQYLEDNGTYTIVPFHCDNGHDFCILIGSHNKTVSIEFVVNQGTTFYQIDWIKLMKGSVKWDGNFAEPRAYRLN